MKHLYFILLMVFAMPWQITYAAETEPNNTSAQANTLTLNVSDSGKIDPAGDVDWWKITTVADGKLNITLSNSSGKSIWVYVYDSNSTTLLTSGKSINTFVYSKNGLGAGSYYIKVKCDSPTDTASYTISSSLIVPAQANDIEFNNSPAQALTFALSSTKTGHVGYYYNKKRDTADWYKVTANKDGRLDLSLAPVSGSNTGIFLYDNDGVTLLNSKDSTIAFTLSTDGLGAGVYYVKVNCTTNSNFAAYTLKNSLVSPGQAADAEPNNSLAQAATLALNSSQPGHVGYYYNNKRDTTDWYKVTTNEDGKLDLSLTPVNGADTWVYLYDNNGTTLLGSKNSNVAFTLSKDGLAAGTYFVKINCTINSQFTPYILTNNLVTTGTVNDVEPNNSGAEATTLTLNTTQTGHVGYYYAKKRDTADWYKVTTNKDGKLDLNLTPANGANIWASLYDGNGTTLINSKDSNIAFTLSTDGLSPGTYFIKINCTTNSQFTPYSLTNNLDALTLANDTEPNNTKAEAVVLALNSTQTGHVGYYYNNKRDTADWYQVTIDKDGKLDINVTPSNGTSSWIYLYDNNGTTLLNSKNSGVAFALSTDGLAAGTYFVKINCSDNSQSTGYTLTNTLVTPVQANDAETNNTPEKALSLSLNSKKAGHVGYYYKNKRDTSDWYKITTKIDTKLKLTLSLSNGQPVTISLYAGNGISLINSSTSGNSFSLFTDGLEDDVYYVKINCKTSSGFAPYTLTDSIFAPPTTDTLILPLNYRITDTLQTKGDVDWFKVTTNADGRLDLTITPVTSKYMTVTLYDHDATTELSSNTSLAASFPVSKDGLAAGTYYVKVKAYNSNDTLRYLLADTLRTIQQANDVEPNNKRDQANILKLNSSTAGHVGYLYDGKRDTADWYKVTTNADGRLTIYATPVNGNYITVNLYDNDGTSSLESTTSTAPLTVVKDGLAAGTYYVKVICYNSNQFTPYILSDTLLKPAQANDLEPNNSAAKALTLKLNGGTTGHSGYYYDHKRDTADWYKVTTNADGRLTIYATPVNGNYITVNLYDNDGISSLESTTSTAPLTVVKDGLAAGTYYVKVICYNSNQFTPYILSDTLLKPAQANDLEPNNSAAKALTLKLNSGTTGHSGYYYDHKRDTADWYTVTTNANGRLTIYATPVNGNYITVNLYDNDGISSLESTTSTAPLTVVRDGLAAGTYYVRVICYNSSQFTPYILSDTLVEPAQANDLEPNNNTSKALTLNLNGGTTGHVGYLYDNKRDTADWYKVTTNADGRLTLYATPVNGNYITVNLYDNDGISPLESTTSTAPLTVVRDGLAAGTYYVKVNCYYSSQFTPYTLSDTLVKPAQANDSEPNNSAAKALTLKLNGATTGHSGYYYDHKRDTADWYKVTTNTTGRLTLSATPVNGNYITVNLYGNDGTTLLSSNTSTAAFTVSKDGLAAGTYFVKVNCYYSSQFTPYTLSNTSASATVAARQVPKEINEGKLSGFDNVTIYPNPVSNRLHIQVNKLTALASVSLRDANGKQVWSQSNLTNIRGGGGLDVNVENFPGGIYFLQMIDVHGKNITKKIIVVK